MTVSRLLHASLKLLIPVIALFFVSPLFTSSPEAQDDGWQIVRADYGFREHRNDVTRLLRDLIVRGGVNGRIAVNNQTMGGDPAIGRDKTLHILARNRRNEQREFEYREGGFVDVGFFGFRNDDWDDRRPGDRDHDDHEGDHDRGRERDLFILRGYYGIQGHMVNVTENLRSMVRDGMLSFYVNNASLGGDPAIGADKVLIVIYRFRGEEQAAAVREGNRVSIP